MTVLFDPHRNPVPAKDVTTVVYDNHRFCVGRLTNVEVMSAPHRHSQIEINFILTGSVDYWFDGREATLSAGDLALFWGMVPHRTVRRDPGTTFICLYVPLAFFLGTPLSDRFRSEVLFGAMLAAKRTDGLDSAAFGRWQEDLLAEDDRLHDIVRDELIARLRRMDHAGWRRLAERPGSAGAARRERSGLDKVEQMALTLAERAQGDVSIAEVAAAVGLHPNYAMTLFRRTVGLTLHDYLTRHRLDTAQSLLLSSNQDVTAVAFAAGFGSLSRFYEAFTKRFGMSPARYRKLHRGGTPGAAAGTDAADETALRRSLF